MERSDTLLELKDIHVSRGGNEVIRGVSLAIGRGMHFLLGPNGAGKTTLLRVIAGLDEAQRGTIVLRGRPIETFPGWKRRSAGLTATTQSPSLVGECTVLEHVQMVSQTGGAPGSKRMLNEPYGDKLIEEVLTRAGLWERRDIEAAQLSHGQRKWLEISCGVVQAPDVLVLDEPAAGIADVDMFKLSQLLRDVAKTCSLLVIEHRQDLLQHLDGHVFLLDHGQIVFEGALNDAWDAPLVKSIYLGDENK